MSEEKHKDSELDKFFQSRLNRPDKDGQGWDSPPNYVFDNALKEMDALDKSKRKTLLLWIISGSFVIIMASFVFWNNGRMKSLDDKMNSLLQNQSQVEEQSLAQTKEQSISGKNEASNTPSATPATEHSKSALVEPESSLDYATPPDRSIDFSSAILNATKTLVTNTTTNEVGDHNGNPAKKSFDDATPPDPSMDIPGTILTATNTITPNTTTNVNEKNNEIPTKLKYDDEEEPVVKVVVVDPVKVTDQENSNTTDSFLKPRPSSTTVYLLAGRNASSLSMSSNQVLPDHLTKYDSWYYGYQLGFGMEQSISDKWTLNYAFRYQKVVNQSTFSSQTTYDETDANNLGQNDQGEEVYINHLDFESPIGGYSESLQFELMNASPSQGDDLENIANITNTFRIIQFGLGTDYSIYSKKKLRLFAGFGIGVNYVAEMQQNMALELYHNQQMLSSEGFKTSSKNQLSPYFASGYLGLGLSYSLKPKWVLGVRGNYETAFQSLRKVVGQAQVKTHLSTFRTSVSLGWRL